MELWTSLSSLRCKKGNKVLEAIKMYPGNVIKERSNPLIKSIVVILWNIAISINKFHRPIFHSKRINQNIPLAQWT